jgi:hypothetical protein
LGLGEEEQNKDVRLSGLLLVMPSTEIAKGSETVT